MGLFNRKQNPVQAVQPSIPTPASISEQSLDAAESQIESQIVPQEQPQVQYQPQMQESVPQAPQTPVKAPEQEVRIQQVPVFLDQSAVNNLVIENNIMLKELLSIAQED